jgi:ubiquinone/menaquinone biosynthesis C-methylase UbiE
MLNLDALILGSYLEDATEWAAELAPDPAIIMDVGAGSGAGTVALARRFPEASIVAIDKSAGMLKEVVVVSAGLGFAGQVSTLQADLDDAWPASAAADLIWASSSLHELADPQDTMRDMFAALNPGGRLLVMEMDSLPRFLPASAFPGLESRLHAALVQQGWNAHPDWRSGLERAGFTSIEQRSFPTVGSATPELTARYARTFLSRIRRAVVGLASPEDLISLDLLLADGPDSLVRRTDLQVHGSRTGWAALKA